MPAGIAPTPSDAPVGQQKKGSASSVQPIPFARASKWHIEQSNTTSISVTASSAAQVLNFPIASYGYLSAILVTVQAGAAFASGASPYEDAPWSIFSQVQLSDVNGVPLFQLSGFNAYLAAKYGGYRLFGNDSILKGASSDGNANIALTGGGGPPAAVATGVGGLYYQPMTSTGAYKFVLPIWLEFGVDGLGCLPNMDASARYNLQLTVAGSPVATSATAGPVYAAGTTPATQTINITVEILARSQPPAQDMFGNPNSVSPPSVGTVQYWTAQTATNLSASAQTIQLTRVGNLIRTHILVFRDSAGTRATAESTDMPSLFEFDWDVGQRYIALLSTLRYVFGWAVFGIDSPNGVLLLPNTTDPDKLAISEYGDEWLGTVGATKFTLRYTPTAGTHSLTVITNDIVPASAQVYQAPMLLTS